MVRDIKNGSLVSEQRLRNLSGAHWGHLTHMISVMASHSRNQNHFTFFEFRHEMKNVEKEELIVDNVVQEGSIASIQSLRLLLVQVGVFSGFLPNAKNIHRRLVVAHCFLAIDIISIYALQHSYNSFSPHLQKFL